MLMLFKANFITHNIAASLEVLIQSPYSLIYTKPFSLHFKLQLGYYKPLFAASAVKVRDFFYNCKKNPKKL